MKNLFVMLVIASTCSSIFADEYFVSVKTGKGKDGTKEKPAKDLGNIIEKLKAGDTINVAGGVYLGKAECGCDQIKVPVKIIGGWSDDFNKRDPWGANRTIFSGKNKSENFRFNPRIEIDAVGAKESGGEIVVDGIIVDNADRNYFAKDEGLVIVRKADPKSGANATPDTPGIAIRSGDGRSVTVQNCIVMNTAPSGRRGAIEVKGDQNSKTSIRNNLVVNNTGVGICVLSMFSPKDGKGKPEFTIENNSILFTWRYDALDSTGGRALFIDKSPTIVRNNVLAFSDRTAIYNNNGEKWQNLTLTDNIFSMSLVAHYEEFNMKIKLENLEDEAEKLASGSKGNVDEKITVPVGESWSKFYAARNIIDRAKAEQGIQPLDNWQNDMRRMLGLPLDGGKLDVKSDVWLHKLAIDDAIRCGEKKYNDKFGCEKPVAK